MFSNYRLPEKCNFCSEPIYQGFARCQKCKKLRHEFEVHKNLVVNEKNGCVFSGAETDVVLPNGDGVWAPYLIELIDGGYLDTRYRYTDKFYEKHPHLRSTT